ncbi:MAG: hypothetical protein FWE37_01025 [Spirochaetaceae bacterium]|nr:hypothetical protein [Spirochaetaceae bacterium]
MPKIALFIFIFSCFTVAAQSANNIEFSVRFQDKQVYYPHSDIKLRLAIRNLSAEDFLFQLADEPFFNVDIMVLTLTNQQLRPSEIFMRRTRSNETRPVLYRLKSLRSGEEHSFEVSLRDFVDISQPGNYIIRVSFRPQAGLAAAAVANPIVNYTLQADALQANSLSLTIRPFMPGRTFIDSLDSEIPEILQQQNLPPDEIMNFTLQARQLEQWDRFFLYIDLEQLFLRNIDRARRYQFAAVEVRAQMLADFRAELMAVTTEMDLSTIPYEFTILSTFFTPTNAVVTTRQVYRQRQFNEVREFRWFLRRGDNGIWLIYDYEVTNLGTER